MPRPLEPNRDHTGTWEDWFLFRLLAEVFTGFWGELLAMALRLAGWLCWQAVRLVCSLVSEALTSWHF